MESSSENFLFFLSYSVEVCGTVSYPISQARTFYTSPHMLESKSIPFHKNAHFLQMIDLLDFGVDSIVSLALGILLCELFAINMTKNAVRDAIVC